MMIAIVPVNVGTPTVVICMQKLVSQCMVDLLLTDQMIMAKNDLHAISSVQGANTACSRDAGAN